MTPNPEQPHQAIGAAAIPLMLQVVADLFLQLDARFDALRTVVCELHPEVADRLEDLIQHNTRANKEELQKREKMLAVLQSVVPGPIQ